MGCHVDGVLRRVTLMDSDYLEGWRRYVEVCEPGVLQVVKVAFSQSVPEPDNININVINIQSCHTTLR